MHLRVEVSVTFVKMHRFLIIAEMLTVNERGSIFLVTPDTLTFHIFT